MLRRLHPLPCHVATKNRAVGPDTYRGHRGQLADRPPTLSVENDRNGRAAATGRGAAALPDGHGQERATDGQFRRTVCQ
jgi:hypothetical protein